MSGLRRSDNGTAKGRAPVSDRLVATLDLPPQQTRIVVLLLQGKQDKEIASLMGLKVPTVRTHLGRLFARFRVSNRIGLAVAVMAELGATREAGHQN